MKITYIYKDPNGDRKEVTRHSDVPRKGDVVRITNFPEIEKEYVVTKVTWSVHTDKSINPDTEATVSLFAMDTKISWMGL